MFNCPIVYGFEWLQVIFFQIFGGLLEVVAQDLRPGPSLVPGKGGGAAGKVLGYVSGRLGTNWGH